MTDWYDKGRVEYDLDEEGDELSRAICAAAIKKGLDPNDYGVVPEAEIVPAAVAAKRFGVTTATVLHYRRQERAMRLAEPEPVEMEVAEAMEYEQLMRTYPRPTSGYLANPEPGEMEVAEPEPKGISLQFVGSRRFAIPLVLFGLSLLTGPLFGLPAWVVMAVLASSFGLLSHVDNQEKKP